MHPQRDPAGTRGEKRQVAGELDAVAETLFRLYVDVLTGEVLAFPRPFREAGALALGRAQPPLVFVPAFAEIAAHEQENAEPGMGVGVVRRKRQRVAQRGDALLVGSVVVQRGAEIGPGLGIVGLDRDGAAIADGRLVELPQRMQGVAEIAVRLGEFRVGGDRLAVDARGLLVVLELVERDAEIAQRHRHVGLDLDRPPRSIRRRAWGGRRGGASRRDWRERARPWAPAGSPSARARSHRPGGRSGGRSARGDARLSPGPAALRGYAGRPPPLRSADFRRGSARRAQAHR